MALLGQPIKDTLCGTKVLPLNQTSMKRLLLTDLSLATLILLVILICFLVQQS